MTDLEQVRRDLAAAEAQLQVCKGIMSNPRTNRENFRRALNQLGQLATAIAAYKEILENSPK